MIYDVIIIGAGAAGLFCGAMMDGVNSGLILEKTGHAGRKLLMSGSGQCNITHGGSIKDFISCYGKNGGKIRRCLYRHNNLALMDFLEKGGVPTMEREDGKVFPSSLQASDVLALLMRRAKENGFEIVYHRNADRLRQGNQLVDSGAASCGSFPVLPDFWQVHANGQWYAARNLIIATGGCSYPSTGSDGALFDVLRRDLEIAVTPLRPALSPIQVEAYPYGDLSGISFENARITILRNKRTGNEKKIAMPANNTSLPSSNVAGTTMIAENTGPLLFTHEDLSGPVILNISKFAEPRDIMQINYLYPLTREQALERLKAASHGAKGNMTGLLADTFGLPKRLCKVLTERYGNSLKTLAGRLTGETFCITSVSGFHKAMATSGGISLDQIDTATMAFKSHSGLFAIGEALDVDGITGGYNLQFAYSSACAAAEAVKKQL